MNTEKKDPVADELTSMRSMWKELQKHTPAAQHRIVTYLQDRLAEKNHGTAMNGEEPQD